MKDTKVLRAQRSAALLQRQFLHGDGSLFDQVFDTPALTTVLAEHGTSCRGTIGLRPRIMAYRI